MTERLSRVVKQLNVSEFASNKVEIPLKQKSGFIYTKDEYSHGLSHDQRVFYEREGYLIVRGLFSADEIRVWNDHFVKLCNDKRKRKTRMIVMRDINLKLKEKTGVMNITKFQDFEDDKVFMRYCRNEKIQNFAQAFCGPNLNSVHTMFINKPPDLGKKSSRHPLHQDLWYFPFRPTNDIVASWTALQHIDRHNGGLCVLPGSHHHHPGGKLRTHEYPKWTGGVNKFYHTVADEQVSMDALEGKLLYPSMGPGDVIFFHPLLIHGSNLNNSNDGRKSLCSHFCSSDCYYIEVRDGDIQQPLRDEMDELTSKMEKTSRGRAVRAVLGKDYRPTFAMIWKGKTAHVRGRKGSMGDFRDFIMEQLKRKADKDRARRKQKKENF